MKDKNPNSNLYNKIEDDSVLDEEKLPSYTNESEDKSSSKPVELIESNDSVNNIKTGQTWQKKLLVNKKISIPFATIALLIIVFAVPISRYKVLGLFWKQTYSLVLADSQTNLPVSDATVKLDGKTTSTDNQGRAKLKVAVGSSKLMISKSYYKTLTESIMVGLKPKANVKFQLVATGRQVPINVVNIITSNPASNIEVTVTGTSAKTDNKGQVTIVLPADKSTVDATLSGNGYNSLKATIQVTSRTVAANTFKVTPSGQVYFLSNSSGKIDVVKTNLDGTDRETVLAGTGTENPNNTSLLASRDWKYLGLQAKRMSDPSSNSIYLIDTTNNKLTTIDSGDASFTPVGWSGHRFVYTVDRSATIPDWQPNQYVLKSYNADTGTLTTIDQTTAQGTSQSDWLGQDFGDTYIISNQLVYTIGWAAGYQDFAALNNKQATLVTVNSDGTNKKTIYSFSVAAGCQTADLYIASQLYEPDSLYLQDPCNQTYKYENGQVFVDSSVGTTTFNEPYPTYLESPSGNQTFWSEQRDGKNTLFVGDANSSNGKQIATLSDYQTYGWYTDNYLLVEKSGSELYIMPVGGGTALKVSDYYKPPQNFNGYGGGYGGL